MTSPRNIDVVFHVAAPPVEHVFGCPVRCCAAAAVVGDPCRTEGDAARAWELLGWRAHTSVGDGVRTQVEWHESRRDGLAVT
ncbi:MAG TPA: hypothetical protein VEP49_05820 [Acidimicrobiia bacterium]|nr:hypothetical protein [Acidimicrobiia bacterium]